MKNKKTTLKYFNVMQYEEEADYLQKEHASGWKFVKVTFPGIYRFVKCEPEEVVYQLDYNQEGRMEKQEYVQMFQDCGWEYLFDFAGYSYFRKPVSQMNGDEKIFCDNESRGEMLSRVFKGRIIPLIAIFCCCILPQLFMQINGGDIWDNSIFLVLMVLFLLYLFIFIKFAVSYWKLKNRR